ncbi:hypothetical protein QFC22_006290 [Naganishia vaughanmartiniae]|uniref:Uncharacterized protein n=1 Tax=Naganishia vaughanmartiniae TaxID=1424756 RepID=A0ACC2WMA0_9TREE|nr:hypothetical protein QFC22_006290 [Naganishia vaughanmartiniae]
MQHDLFKSDMYKSYAERVLQTARTAVAPMDVQFQQVMPRLHTKMDTISGLMEIGIKDLQITVDQNMSKFRKEMEPVLSELGATQGKQAKGQKIIATALSLMANSLKLFSEGTFETRFRPNDDSTTQLHTPLSPPVPQAMSGGGFTSFEKNLSEVTQTTHDLLNETQPPTSSTSSGSTSMPQATTISGFRSGILNSDKTFVMETNHATVGQLWKEWTVGVSGRESVIAMLEGKYAKSEKQRKLYSRRKIVIDEVKRLADMRTEPEAEIVKSMDGCLSQRGLSMTKLQDLIKARNQDGKTLAFWLDTE